MGLEAELRDLFREEVAPLRSLLAEILSRLGERRPPQQAASGGTVTLNEFLTRKQAAEIMGYSLRTIARLMDSDQLRACGPRRDRISRFEIDRFMAAAPPRKDLGEDDLDAEADRLLDDDK